MQLQSALIALALSATATSEFFIVTRPAFHFDLSGNIQSEINALSSEAASRLASLTASLPSSDLSRASSAHTALVAFVATAAPSLSVPTDITSVAAFTTFSATPAWFTALPSDLQSYYNANNAKVQSVINGLQSATGTDATAGPKSTGAASRERVVRYVGVGAAAAMAGVFAL
ncbi:hypothetical protein ACEQ8H_006030 [Pleosporales sp. CAS-2024a]